MGSRLVAWLFVVVLSAAFTAAQPYAARAQNNPQPAIGADPSPRTPPLRPSNTPSPSNDGDVSFEDDAPIQRNDSSGLDASENSTDAAPADGTRPVPLDGDMNDPPAPNEPQDGVIDVSEPVQPDDAGDAQAVDTRPSEDIAIFADIPAGADPLLFQIEDIDPIRDNRVTSALARLDPYDPIGIKIGSFVLFPEFEVSELVTSNALSSPDARNDVATGLRPAARLVSNWSNHALEFRGVGNFTFYDEFSSENDETYGVEARGRLDVTRQTNIQAILSHDRSLESRTSISANAVGERTPIEIDRAEVALNHRFNRLTVQLRGSVSDFAFGDTANLGMTTSNADRNYTQTEQTARATWEFKPTLSAFSEVSVNQRDYDQPAQSDLINRTSDGERYRVGLAFGNTGQILRGEISLGYGIQATDSPLLRDIDGLILDANATWRITELTSVLFNARSDVTETNTASVGGALSRSAGVEVRHALRRHLIVSAGLAYTVQDSLDGVIDDKELRTTLGVEYFANRETVLFGAYEHTSFDGVGAASDYGADELRVGVRLRR